MQARNERVEDQHTDSCPITRPRGGVLALTLLVALPLLTAMVAPGATITKATSGTDLTDGASWTGGTAPGSGDIAAWGASSAYGSLTIGSSVSWGRIQETGNPAGTIVITGAGTLTLNGVAGGTYGIEGLSTGSNKDIQMGCPITLGGSQLWVISTGRTVTQSGAVGGSSSVTLTKYLGGALVLSAANAFSGTITFAPGGYFAGSIRLAHQNALQNATFLGSSPSNGGTFTFDSSVSGHAFTFGAISASSAGIGRNIALQDNAGTPNAVALTVGGNGSTTTYAGVLSAGGSVIKAGAGTLTLSGANTYTGGTTLNAGILNAGIGQSGTTSGPLGASGAIVFGGGTLQFSAASSGWDPSARIASGTQGLLF